MNPLLAFRPKLLEAVHGYNKERFIQDVGAGVTVGVVALPLAMAFAIASGLKPEAGLFTAIIAGFLISALGGSRVQIGGPAGAFIVIVYGILERYGLANLIIATAMSGVILFVMGLLRLGTLIRFIPVAVVIGFTNGIAVLIAVSQLKDFFGLPIANMPADFFSILLTLAHHMEQLNVQALALASGSLLVLVVWQLLLPRWQARLAWLRQLTIIPGSIVVLVGATVVALMCKPLPRALAASPTACLLSRCPVLIGKLPNFFCYPPALWRCWVRSSRCCAHVWPIK
jgi:sulfate permease, SulP family